jgi:hypothetical protein
MDLRVNIKTSLAKTAVRNALLLLALLFEMAAVTQVRATASTVHLGGLSAAVVSARDALLAGTKQRRMQ